jgi:hypothetical protein
MMKYPENTGKKDPSKVFMQVINWHAAPIISTANHEIPYVLFGPSSCNSQVAKDFDNQLMMIASLN